MNERALRGSRLGASSYESDEGVEFAPREPVAYDCPRGHRMEVPFAADAEVPSTWECRSCGRTAVRVDVEEPSEKRAKIPRTHWDMLLERRSVDELEKLLAERLELLRAGRSSARRKSA